MSKRDLALAPSADIMTQVRHLSNGAWQARLHAVKHLAEICGGAAVPELIERLDDNHSLVRAAAISALGQIGGDEARVALHRFMAEGRPDSPLAAEELANWGEEATPALLYGLEVGTTPVQVAALRALGKIRDPGAVQGIMTALRDPAGPVINAAWEALMRIPGDTALQALVDRLGDWPPSTRISAIRRIGERRFTPAVPALCRQLDDENESVVRAAGFALMDIAIPEAHVRALMKPLFNLRGMRHHNDSRLVPPLLLALEHGGHWLRWESSRWLAHIAQTAPCPGLALALPLLKRHLGFFAGTPQPEREVHQRTYDLIDGAMDRQLNRPIPASPPLPDRETLPRPSGTDG